jgi:hypothetical protein
MDERLSIIEDEKFIECRLCNHLVGSLNPTCKNCGLEMSSEGILELAEFEEIDEKIEKDGFIGIYSLRILAILSLAMTLFGAVFFLSFGLPSFFKLYFGTGLFIYLAAYLSWNKKYLKQKFGTEETELIAKEKRLSLMIFTFSILIGVSIFVFLLK